MKVSIFTPSHAATYLDECHRSVVTQTHADWEWIVLPNGDADWVPPEPDPRIRVLRGTTTGFVGAIKREACALAEGEILVELDHDDLLAPHCLAEVVTAFGDSPDVVLVYSDWAQIDADGSANFETFNTAMGREYAPANVAGLLVNSCRAMAPSPHSVSYIWYAPNHVRAFRRTAYEEVGGYDASLEVLDDQDLMMRLYEIGSFRRIAACLYLQHIHDRNTQKDLRINKLIQDKTVTRYHQGVNRMAIAWARRQQLAVLDLHTAQWPDRPLIGDIDVAIDPEDPRLPYDNGEVGVIVATELLQRLPDRLAFFAECHRVLAHGGLILTTTPSTDGRGAFQDPTHVSYWNENSFWYLTQAPLRDRVFPGHRDMRFQISGIMTYFPTDFDAANKISYVGANLLAIKGGPLLR